MRLVLSPLLLLLALLPAAFASGSAPATFTSGPARVSLVELYTSEGCSSCPPADRWLGALRADPRLWHDFVPIAFHVNYWDSLGWKDRLSSAAFTKREYTYSAEWGSASVYTPCFVLNGSEWHADPAALTSSGAAPAGILALELTRGSAGNLVAIHYQAAKPGHFIAHVALLGGGITTKVRAGENSGSTLAHEFAVLALAEAPLADSSATVTLPPPLVSGAPRSALVGWITTAASARPLQATGGWLE